MTYGEIESTPQRLREYQIPKTPSRDLVLEQLNKKILSGSKERKESAVMKLLASSPMMGSEMGKRRESSFVRKEEKEKGG